MSNMVINTNVGALNSHRALKMVGNNITRASERLASGLRINRAADDAAGLAISEKMRSQIRGLDQASRNAQDGISLIQTAEGALQETENMLQRMRELVVQAANDTLETSDKQKISLELNQLTQEIDATASRTEFNKKKLIDGSWANTSLYFQVGANASQGLRVNIAKMDATWLGVTKDQIGDIVAAGDRVGTTIQDTKVFVGVDTLDFANSNTLKDASGVYNFSNGAKMTITDNGVFTMQGFDNDGTFDTKDVFAYIPPSFSTPDGLRFDYTPGNNNGPGVLKYTSNKTPAVNGDTKPIQPPAAGNNPALSTVGINHFISIEDTNIATPNVPANMRYTFTGTDIVGHKTGDGQVSINSGQTYTGTELANAFGPEGGTISLDNYKIKVAGTGIVDTTVGAIKAPVAEGTPIRTNFISTPPPSTNTPTNPNQMTYISNNIFKGTAGNTSILDFTDNDVVTNSSGTYGFSGGAKITINDDGSFIASGFDANDGTYNTADASVAAPVIFTQASTGLQLDYTPGAAAGPGTLSLISNSTSDFVSAVSQTITAPTGPAPSVTNLDGTKTQITVIDATGTGTGTAGDMSYIFKYSNSLTATDSNGVAVGGFAAAVPSGGPAVTDAALAGLLSAGGGTGAGIITADGINIAVLATGVVDTATPATRAAVVGTTQAAITYDPAATNSGTGNTGAGVVGTLTTGNTAPIINIDEGKFMVNNQVLTDSDGVPMGSGEVISLLTTRIDQAIEMVSSQRAMLGAYQNRMEHTINNLDIASQNLSASESRIRDADMAMEMMNLTKANVLSQAATSMLAQANMQPNNVLQLLR